MFRYYCRLNNSIMARIKVPLRGVTSQSNHQDGECKNIVNLRPERGYYKPVTPRKVVRPITGDYDIVFVHRGNDYENWIGVKNVSGSTFVVYTDIDTTPVSISNYLPGSVNSVQQIGNTLSFITDETIYYALYKGTAYSFLGELPDLPALYIGAHTEFTMTRYFSQDYDESKISVKGQTNPDGATIPVLEPTRALIYKARDVLVNGGLNPDGTPFTGVGMLLFDAHFVRYAFRLYDGSVIKHSSPLLVMPAKNILDTSNIRYTVGTTFVWDYTTLRSNSYVNVTGYNLGIAIDLFDLTPWEDIITSVDIFMSPPLGLMNPENLKQDRVEEIFRAAYSSGGVGVETDLYSSLNEESLKQVATESRFYLIKSLVIGEWNVTSFLNPYIIPTSQTDFAKLENLIYQEQMPEDNFSHHIYGSGGSYVFNNRLRLSDITTTFFKGFTTEHFQWRTAYNGTLAQSGDFHHTIIETELLINNRVRHVYSFYSNYFGHVPFPFFQAFLSYPDSRARRMRIYVSASGTGIWNQVFSAPLEPHPYLNIAYYLNDQLQPITMEGTTTRPEVTGITPITLIEPNKLKVSEVNNPFVFPNANTYLVGSGEILGESSIIMNVSDRNYGMYPVFVFTTDGVFTMAGQDVDTVHASIQAPTYLEPPISNVICATPYGVVFITKRGLMQISNYKTESLSQVLREDDDIINIDLTGITDPAISYPSVSFRKFLESCTNMVYNPYDDELIISASGYSYNYVYDYETKSFYLSTNLVGQVVQNTFPDIYYISAGNLIDISQSNGDAANVRLLTRPIQFESTDIKKLERVFLRALMYNVNGLSVAAYHSADGVHFTPIKGVTFGAGGNYKDFDLGLLARETYRQYLFLLTGTIDEESQIEYIEFEVDKNYNNEKMR